jgi:T-complex protein 1 subunit delta
MKQDHNIGKNLDSEKSKDIRQTNIVAARAVADVVRTSLGPRGMDKMVSQYHYFLLSFLDSRSKWKSVDYK